MADLEEYGISLETVRRMYEAYQQGAAKSALERKYLNKPESHGKVFSSLVRTHLGIETERRSRLAEENAKLRRLIRPHGISEDSGEPGTHDTGVGRGAKRRSRSTPTWT